MAEEKVNMKNPAVKRILQELKDPDFMALPLQDNIFDWQLAIRGLSDTEFEGGIYHGRIQLTAEYPFQLPSFMLLTPLSVFHALGMASTEQLELIHQSMLNKAPPYPQLVSPQLPEEHIADRDSVALQVNNQNADAMADGEENAAVPEVNEVVMVNRHEVHLNANAGPLRVRFSAGLRVTRRVAVDTNGQLQRLPERRTRRRFLMIDFSHGLL